MKNRVSRLTCLVSLILIFNCSSDDGPSGDIVGTWKLVSLEVENSYDFDGDGQSSNDLLIESNCNVDDFLIFDSDGTGSFENQSTRIDIGYEMDNNMVWQYDISCDEINLSIGYNWQQDGDLILLTDSFLGDTELSKNGLTLTYFIEDGYNVPILNGTMFPNFSLEDVTLTYRKQ